MHRSKMIVIAVILTLGITGVAAGVGKHRYGSPEKRATHVVNHISENLNLDATQQQALSVFKDQLISSRTSVKSDMANLHQETTSLITRDVFDRAQALNLISTRTAQFNSFAPDLVNSLGDFLDSLNSEQKSQIAEFITNHRHRYRKQHHETNHGWKHK